MTVAQSCNVFREESDDADDRLAPSSEEPDDSAGAINNSTVSLADVLTCDLCTTTSDVPPCYVLVTNG
jgi:hypothetical protein